MTIRERTGGAFSVGPSLLAIAPALLGATIFYLSRVGQLFPLIEFRSWLEFRSVGPVALLRTMLVRDEVFSRHLSLEFVKTSGALCGIDIPCLNAVNYLPVPIAAALLFVLLRQLGAARGAAGATAFAWVFSEPMAVAMGWQATIHDRLAACFSFGALCAAVHWVARAPGSGARSWRRPLLANATVLALVMLAYDSKEAAFFLLPSLFLLPFVCAPDSSRRTLARAYAHLVAPLAYAVFHLFRYLEFLERDPTWRDHTGSGVASDNVRKLAPHLLNAPELTGWVTLVFAALAALVVLALALEVRDAARGTSPWPALAGARTAVWAWASFFAAAALDVKTKYASVYYLMIPAALFYAASTLSVGLLVRRLASPRRAGAVLIATSTCGLLANFAVSFEPISYKAQLSRAFRDGLPTFRRFVPANHAGRIYLVNDDRNFLAYQFTGSAADRAIYPYVYDTLLANESFERRYVDMKTSAWRALPARDPRAAYVVFDTDMHLVRIDEGTRVLFVDPARALAAGVAPPPPADPDQGVQTSSRRMTSPSAR